MRKMGGTITLFLLDQLDENAFIVSVFGQMNFEWNIEYLLFLSYANLSTDISPFLIEHIHLFESYVPIAITNHLPPRHWNTGLVSTGVTLTSWGGTSFALIGHPSDGITIKIPYGVNVLLHWPASHPIFSYWVN